MFKSFKNLVLYDIPPKDDQFLAHPKTFLKRVLFESGSPSISYKENERNYVKQVSKSTSSSDKSFESNESSAVSTTSSSSTRSSIIQQLNLDVVDDGHEFGLGNPKMLKLIFTYLSIPELLVVRQVNLRWNVTACLILRSKLPFIKFPPSKLRPFRKLMRNNITNPISSFAIRIDNVWETNTYKFLSRFASEIFNLRVRLNINEFTEFAKLLQKMENLQTLYIMVYNEGPDNKSHLLLHENLSSWDSGYFDRKEAWKLGLFRFPKLEKIYFQNLNPSFQIHPFYDKIVTRIILASSNLQEINFADWNSPIGKIFSKFEIIKPGILNTVGKGATEDELTNLFFTSNLVFYKLRLEVTPKISFELVSDIIHKCAESTHELCVANENIFEKFSISSALRHLLRLRLDQWSGSVDFYDFSKQFPALKHLSLNLSNLFEVESGIVDVELLEPCKMVKTLTLMRLETGIDAALIEKLAKIFPDVVELFIEVKNGAALEKIYQVYPDLTLLCLELKCYQIEEGEEDQSCSAITNQAFTGVPDELIVRIKNRECGCPIIEFQEEARECWNIGCLKNLTTLLLRVPNTVDNIALLEGISRLHQLENLVILPFYDHDEEPIKWCLRSIADNFPRLKTLVTSTEVQYLENDLQYLYKKLPKLIHKMKP